MLRGTPGAETPHSGKGHVLEGSQMPTNTPRSLPSPRGLIQSRGMPKTLRRQTQPPPLPMPLK